MKSGARVDAYMNGRPLGAFTRAEANEIQFEYDSSWQRDSACHALSLSLPVEIKRHRDTPGRPVVSNFLWGLLPDNPNTLRHWARHFQIGRGNPLAFLEQVGADCPGAVTFGAPEACREVRVLSTAELAHEIGRLRLQQPQARLGGDVGRFSLAGAQAKTALQKRADGWYLPQGESPTTHIFKPPMDGLYEQVVNEYACMSAAKHMGLPCAGVSVEQFGDEIVLVIERYDRQKMDDGTIRRVHQEDMCQALGVHPDDKYQADGGPAIEDLARILMAHSNDPEEDRERLYRAVAFNWLIAGSDAHAKNYSLLLGPQRGVRLAPLYDINSAWPYEDRLKDTRSAVKIGSHYQIRRIRVRDWLTETAKAFVSEQQARGWLSEMTQQLPDTLLTVKKQCQEQGLPTNAVNRIVDKTAIWCSAIAGQLAQAQAPRP